MGAGKWSQRYIQFGTKTKQNQDRDRNREQSSSFTVSGHLRPWDILVLFFRKQVARPQDTQQRPQYTDLAVVASTSSEAHSQSHNPSGLARTALYNLQLPCLVTLNLPNSHGTFLSQRQTTERLESELQHPLLLVSRAGGRAVPGLAGALQTLLSLLSTCLSHSANTCGSLSVATLCTQG